jgi:hypothetical protein
MNQLPLFADEKEPPIGDGEWTDFPGDLPVTDITDKIDPGRKAPAEWWQCPASDYNAETPADCCWRVQCGKPGCAYKKTGKPPVGWTDGEAASPSTLYTPFVAFDLEIARPFESGRPYGVSCAATLTSAGELLLWHGAEKAPGATLPAQMNPREVQDMVGYLLEQHALGHTVVTFNGAGFDLDVLAEECLNDLWAMDVAKLAVEHVDIGFLMLAQMGYMTRLVKLSEGLGVGTKTEGMHGDLAPILWNGWPDGWYEDEEHAEIREGIKALDFPGAPGRRSAQDLCLEYVAQDARITADTYTGLIEQGHVYWTTQKGTRSRYPWRPETKPGRLLTVNESCALPLPDTSWMSGGPRQTREGALAWIKEVS